MNVTLDKTMYVDMITAAQMMGQVPPPPEAEDANKVSGTDEYIPSMSSFEGAMPTGTYNASGMMVNDVSSALQVSATDESDSDYMDALSTAFRANADSIQMTLDSLGLTIDDLSDEENMKTFAAAMNEGAAKIGVPQIEDLDSTIESLLERFSTVTETETV